MSSDYQIKKELISLLEVRKDNYEIACMFLMQIIEMNKSLKTNDASLEKRLADQNRIVQSTLGYLQQHPFSWYEDLSRDLEKSRKAPLHKAFEDVIDNSEKTLAVDMAPLVEKYKSEKQKQDTVRLLNLLAQGKMEEIEAMGYTVIHRDENGKKRQ